MPDLAFDDTVHTNETPGPSARRSWAVPGSFPANLYTFWLIPAAVLFGWVLRTREWLHDKSLWLDEIGIAQSLIHRNYLGLLGPLPGEQSGPVPWLWAEHASTSIFGPHELALRLVPFLASLAALAIFPLVARTLIGPFATPAATVLMAASPALIYYAAETKQYSTDTLCALLVVWVTIRLIGRRPDLRSSVLWGAACGALAWCSQPAILVAAAASTCLILRWLHDRRALLAVLSGSALLGVSIGLEWYYTLRQVSAYQSVRAFWQAFHGFPPPFRTWSGELGWVRFATVSFSGQVGHFALPGLAVALAVWGLVTMVRLRPWPAVLVSLILLAALGAALTDHYPLSGRLALYLFPFAAMLMTAGLDDASPGNIRSLPRPWRYVTAAICAVALVITTAGAVASGAGKLVDPDDTSSGRQAVQFVAANQQPSDLVVGNVWSELTFRFYGPRYGVNRNGVAAFLPKPNGTCVGDRLAPLGDARRVWLVLDHLASNEPQNRNEVFKSQFAVRGTLTASFDGPGDSGAYLYNLDRPPVSPIPPLPADWVPNGCFTIRVDHPLHR